MLLKDAIKRNQARQARFKKYEKLLRRLRQRIFDYVSTIPEVGN